MVRFLFIALFIYLVYKTIKIIFYAIFSRKVSSKEPVAEEEKHADKRKIITKDEGEYVDFEELDDN